MPVYQSPDGTILETLPGQTVRFSQHDIVREQPTRISPMPPGLLNTAGPQDLADLYAYLQTL